MPPALVTCWTGYPYPVVICPVPRKVDGKGLADLEPGFLSWWEGWGRKGSNRVGRRENGVSSSHLATTTTWTEPNPVSGNSLRNPGRAGGEPSMASTPCCAQWRSMAKPPSAHIRSSYPFHLHSEGWLFSQVVPRGATIAALTPFEMQN